MYITKDIHTMNYKIYTNPKILKSIIKDEIPSLKSSLMMRY